VHGTDLRGEAVKFENAGNRESVSATSIKERLAFPPYMNDDATELAEGPPW
jgi:hypothetical protein